MTKMSATKLEIPLSAIATIAALAGKRTSATLPEGDSASSSRRRGGSGSIGSISTLPAATARARGS